MAYSTIKRVEPDPLPEIKTSVLSCPTLSDDTNMLKGLPMNQILFLLVRFMQEHANRVDYGLSNAQRDLETDCNFALRLAARQFVLDQST